jgi:hypothetical protein
VTNICIGKNISIHLEKLIESRLLVQANSGGGKSYCLRKILEESHPHVQQVILDIEGEFNTLRERFDYVLVGKDGDIPINLKIAEILPKKIIELGVSFIIDLSELKKHERILFVKRFLNALMELPKKYWKSLLVVVDECHDFAPEKGKAESLGSVIDLCTRGRKRGFCALLATQRLSKLNKDAAAETNNRLIGRTGLDIDMKRAGEELGFTGKDKLISLRHLEPGEFFAFGTAISKGVEKVNIGEVLTAHPRPGERDLQTNISPKSKIKSVIDKLKDLPVEVDKGLKTEGDLRKEIHSLRTEIGILKRGVKPIINNDVSSKKAYRDGLEEGRRQFKYLLKDERRDLQKFITATQNMGKIINNLPMVQVEVKLPNDIKGVVEDKKIVVSNVSHLKSEVCGTSKNGSVTQSHTKDSSVYIGEDFKLSAIQRRILKSLSDLLQVGLEFVPRPMLAAFSESRPKSSHFANSISGLKTLGLVEYGSSTVKITSEGLNFTTQDSAPITDDDLQGRWKNLLSALQKKIIDVVLEDYPSDISREDLAGRIDASSTSSHFANSISCMKTMGALIYSGAGRVMASKNLFIRGGV